MAVAERSAPDLAQLLELVHRGGNATTTLTGVFRQWNRPTPSLGLLVKTGAQRDGRATRPVIRWQNRGPFPRDVVATRKIWFSAPGELRAELWEHGRLVRTGIRRSTRWWCWDPDGHAVAGDLTNPQGGQLPPLLNPMMLSPARVLFGAHLEIVGWTECAGRAAISVKAWPQRAVRNPSSSYQELVFDAMYGTLLAIGGFSDGDCVQRVDPATVEYDQQLPAGLFEPPLAVDVEPTAGLPSVRRVASPSGALPVVPRLSREALPTLWLTGLPGAGKSTLAHAIDRVLAARGRRACVLDGDEIRSGLSDDLGLTPDDRAEQARRVAHVAAIVGRSGALPVVALVSPFQSDRQRARQIHSESGQGFIEVWVDTPLDVCAARDPKGLYARSRAGEITGLTGVDAPYEPPEAAEIQLSTAGADPDVLAEAILSRIFGH